MLTIKLCRSVTHFDTGGLQFLEEIPLEGHWDFEQSDDCITQTGSVLKRKRKRFSTTVDMFSIINNEEMRSQLVKPRLHLTYIGSRKSEL